ncbi:MAG: tyrosine-type recombinase/integrase [Pseudomonadota bacterium]|nr:tyrosine-type recombinase/integrase [Pseudomonadota bacterium]
MGIISTTLGRLSPQFKSISEFEPVYLEMLNSEPIKYETRKGRVRLARIFFSAFGSRRFSSIRPHEIASLLRSTHSKTPNKCRKLRIESNYIFHQAIIAGWADTNPVSHVRSLPCKVARSRMSLRQWQELHKYATKYGQPWEPALLALAIVTAQRRSDLLTMRFDDVCDGWLYIRQQKTGAMIALPAALRLDAVGLSIADVVEQCHQYTVPGDTLIRRRDGGPLLPGTVSGRFRLTWLDAFGDWDGNGTRPTLHEIRSLSERLYRAQGIDTQTLLGHKRQSMTDVYNDDRGLSAGQWRRLII